MEANLGCAKIASTTTETLATTLRVMKRVVPWPTCFRLGAGHPQQAGARGPIVMRNAHGTARIIL